MTLDGPGFHVEIEALEDASKSMIEALEDQDKFELSDLCGPSEMYGHGGVHTGFSDFCQRWSVGLDALCDRARAMGYKLRDAATVYREVDAANARTLTADPALEAVQPPRYLQPGYMPGGT
ncbi:MAG: hypothetical protein ACRDS9_04480 [Pseudonocardiaceae bacterium]